MIKNEDDKNDELNMTKPKNRGAMTRFNDFFNKSNNGR